MTKHHIGKNGPGPCNAKKGPCPLGADVPHFETKEAAEEFYQKALQEEHGATSTVKKKRTKREPAPDSFRGKNAGLLKAAKFFKAELEDFEAMIPEELVGEVELAGIAVEENTEEYTGYSQRAEARREKYYAQYSALNELYKEKTGEYYDKEEPRWRPSY